MDHSTIHLIHLLVLGPALILIGTGVTDNWVPRPAIAVIGAFIALYHIYRLYGRYGGTGSGAGAWINLIHILLVAPALIAYGYTGERSYRELILLLGFAAVGYHGYYYLLP